MILGVRYEIRRYDADEPWADSRSRRRCEMVRCRRGSPCHARSTWQAPSMSVRDVGRRIPAYLACAILCFAMFDVPSAYAYWRGVPWGVALAVGVFVFPVFPVAWHVWSERNAKRAEKPYFS